MINGFNALLKRLSFGSAKFAALALSVSVAVTATDIILRRTINMPVTGVVDITQLSVMWAAFLSIPVAFHLDNHISVVMLTNRFSPEGKRWVYAVAAVASSVLLIVACAMAAVQALHEYESSDRSMILGIPLVWYWLPVVLGFALSSACALGRALEYLFLKHAVEAQGSGESWDE